MTNPISVQDARAFFSELASFSREARKHCSGAQKSDRASPFGEQGYRTHPPTGCIIHYTASVNFENTVADFCNPDRPVHASAHVVIARDRPAWTAPLLKEHPMVAALPCAVIQVRDPDQGAYHATWANHDCYGIELMNAGELRGEGGHYTWWPKRSKDAADWTAPYPGTRPPLSLYGRTWEAWPTEQVVTCAHLAAYANAYFSNPFHRHMFLGHEHVQGVHTIDCGHHDKRDPGPGFPITQVREAVLGNRLEGLPSIDLTSSGVIGRHTILAQLAVGTGGPSSTDTLERLRSLCSSPVTEGSPNVRAMVSMLMILGYDATGAIDTEAGRDRNAATMRIFKKLMGLSPDDGAFDSKVERVLRDRVLDRLFPSQPTAHVVS